MMRFIYVFFQGALEQKGVRQAEFNNIPAHVAYSLVRLMYGRNDFPFKNVLGAVYCPEFTVIGVGQSVPIKLCVFGVSGKSN